ncbi:MAG: VOC family protein [Candidatus Eremiobacteraeota bacterium]|nr:VOC family protein [Candidatus Eremiobacteraeota bacterium]
MKVRRLNHAVLRVRDLDRSLAFYSDVLGLEPIARIGNAMAFMRAPGSENHHDLGLARVGPNAPPPDERAVGLYHLAWEVEEIESLREARDALEQRGALSGASDHGATKSIYGYDPDGNEFEIMWMVPREHWGEFENAAPTGPLNLEAEIAKWGTQDRAHVR